MRNSHQKDSNGETEICLSVEGLPPKKNEATSLFSPRHGDHRNVAELLRKAEQSLGQSSWNPTEPRAIGLELVVIAQEPDAIPGDATNYLGGVADVLQANRINADLPHLGHLANVSLYHDDRQIREVRYSVKDGDALGYRVRIWVL